MPRRERRRLVLAIRATVGSEALAWLTDIAGLSRKQAVDRLRWSARSCTARSPTHQPGISVVRAGGVELVWRGEVRCLARVGRSAYASTDGSGVLRSDGDGTTSETTGLVGVRIRSAPPAATESS